MKTLIKRSFFVALATLAITNLHAQTADDIVNKYLDAIGGRPLLTSLKSVVILETVSANGTDGDDTTWIVYGKGFKYVADFNGTKIVQVIAEKGGWGINPFMGSETPTAIPAEQNKMLESQYSVSPLLDYAANGFKLEYIGKDSNDYKLRLSNSALDITYYINANTYLIDKQINKTVAGPMQGESTVTFSDYRKSDPGYVLPWSQTMETPQYTLNITLKKVTVNAPVDMAIFDMPK